MGKAGRYMLSRLGYKWVPATVVRHNSVGLQNLWN